MKIDYDKKIKFKALFFCIIKDFFGNWKKNVVEKKARTIKHDPKKAERNTVEPKPV